MIKIVVDMMGGDLGSVETKKAVTEFLSMHDDVEIYAVGDIEELKDLNNVKEIIPSTKIMPMDIGAMDALRAKDTSMMISVETMKKINGDALVSCGSTGALLTCSAVKLKKIPGVSRPALISPVPTLIEGKRTVLLDLGASNENTSDELIQFAKMGSLYYKSVYGVEIPSVYLLSNGSEEHKGSPEGKEAYDKLKEMDFKGFKGNIEANKILTGIADVVVTNGYAGNIFLKATEGCSNTYKTCLRNMFKSSLLTKIGYLFVRKGINEMSTKLSSKTTGGAMLVGISKVVVKAHGNSDALAFKNALEVAYKCAKANIIEEIEKGLQNA